MKNEDDFIPFNRNNPKRQTAFLMGCYEIIHPKSYTQKKSGISDDHKKNAHLTQNKLQI